MGWRPEYFLTLHLFQGVNLIGNQLLFNKLKLPKPSPSRMAMSVLPKAQHTCACPCLFQSGEGVDMGVSGHRAAVISSMPQMVPQLSVPFPRHLPQPHEQSTCFWDSLWVPEARRCGVAEIKKGLGEFSSRTDHRRSGLSLPLLQPYF